MTNHPTQQTLHLPHHTQQELCTTRAVYRQGRKLTAVKVYTVNKESSHLLIYNVPAINVDAELDALCRRFGSVLTCSRVAHTQLTEEFTNVFHVHYEAVRSARFTKRELDNRTFFGGVLHVCYAPEMETVEETRQKLITRRKEIATRLKNGFSNKGYRNKNLNKRKFEETQDANKRRCTYDYSVQIAGPSGVEQNSFSSDGASTSKRSEYSQANVDVKPFKALIPRPVSRIVFYNREHSQPNT